MTPRTRRRSGGAPGRAAPRGAAQRGAGPRGADRRAAPAARHRVEFVFLPGLEDVVRDELDRALGSPRVVAVPGRDDAVAATVVGSLRPLLRLRTVVAPFLALRFDVPRPRRCSTAPTSRG